MPVFVVLLRAIGPATHAKMSMRDLRDACAAAGLPATVTYIQAGNLIVTTRKSAKTVQRIVEAVMRSFDLANLVVVRRPDELAAIVAADPFPEAAIVRPSELAVCFLAARPSEDGVARLRRYEGPERFSFVGRDLCVDYPERIAGSRLIPTSIERMLAMPATARDWNTVRKLLAMAHAQRAV